MTHRKSASRASTWSRTVNGAKIGVGIAGILCAWLAVVTLVNGGPTFHTRSGDTFDVWHVVLLYLSGGAITGALGGLCLPMLRWRVGAAIVGVAMAAVLAVGSLALVIDSDLPFRRDVAFVVIYSLAMGIPGGLLLRKFVWSEKHPPET